MTAYRAWSIHKKKNILHTSRCGDFIRHSSLLHLLLTLWKSESRFSMNRSALPHELMMMIGEAYRWKYEKIKSIIACPAAAATYETKRRWTCVALEMPNKYDIMRQPIRRSLILFLAPSNFIWLADVILRSNVERVTRYWVSHLEREQLAGIVHLNIKHAPLRSSRRCDREEAAHVWMKGGPRSFIEARWIAEMCVDTGCVYFGAPI